MNKIKKIVFLSTASTAILFLGGCEFSVGCDTDSEGNVNGINVSTNGNNSCNLSNNNTGNSNNDSNNDSDSEKEDNTNPEVEAGKTVVSLKLENNNNNTENSKTVTFGQIFKKGTVGEDKSLVAFVNGSRVETQVDKKATWKDGSLRHAVISILSPSISSHSSQDLDLKVIQDQGDNIASITPQQLVNSDFNSKITFNYEGQRYQVDAKNILQSNINKGYCSTKKNNWDKNCKKWLTGSLANEWIVGGKPIEGTNLKVFFNIRAYSDGGNTVSSVKVDNIVENNLTYVGNSIGYKYNATIETGDNIFKTDDITHYRQARWHKSTCWKDCDGIYVKQNYKYLQETQAIPKYLPVSPSEKALNNVSQSYPVMDNGGQTGRMEATGAQPNIGPLPLWTSLYAVSGDERAYNYMLANDTSIGSYPFHFRYKATGRPLTIHDSPYFTIANHNSARRYSPNKEQLPPGCDDNSSNSTTCESKYQFDIAHHPSVGYVPYLVTGDYYYLEEMQFSENYTLLWQNENYRKYDKGLITSAIQVRSYAWMLRSLAQTTWATPDNDPLKSQYREILNNNIEHLKEKLVNNEDNKLNISLANVQYGRHTGTAPWQLSFFTWSLNNLADLDFEGGRELANWATKAPIARMTNWKDNPKTGYCWIQNSSYTIKVRDTRNSEFYTSWDEVYKNSFPESVGYECDSQNYTTFLSNKKGNSLKNSEMVGNYGGSPTGFPANMQLGVASAADSDNSKGIEAWQIFRSRANRPDYSKNPTFAIMPRNKEAAE